MGMKEWFARREPLRGLLSDMSARTGVTLGPAAVRTKGKKTQFFEN